MTEAASPRQTPLREPEGVTVLVVDDEQDVSTFLASVIEDAGMTALVANDGNAAHDLIHEKTPDLISLDLVMPGKSGIRLLHEIRKHPKCAKIPVIIVTGHAQDPDNNGATFTMGEPVTVELMEADVATGSLAFVLIEGGKPGKAAPGRRGHKQKSKTKSKRGAKLSRKAQRGRKRIR